MKVYKSHNFSDIYKEALFDLIKYPEYETKPRNLKIKENLNVCLILENPISCLYKNNIRSSKLKYISAELLWYFLGRNDVDFIKKYSSFWENIKNPDNTVNSAYGYLIFNKKNKYHISQYEWAFNSLIKDIDTRQAVIHFNLPDHQYYENKDFVCTMYCNFHIRNNKLYLKVNMRSNDAILGTPTDIAFFSVLHLQMLNHLKFFNYPNLELGSLIHCSDSFHIYEKHFELVESMLNFKFIPDFIPTIELDLIKSDGSPTDNLYFLFDNIKNDTFLINDNLYKWIWKNIRT